MHTTTTTTTQPPICIYVATPAYGCVVTNSYLSSLVVLRAELLKQGINMVIQMTGNESLVQRARNLMTASFMQQTTCTHMLWIDADIAFKPETVLAMLKVDKPLVAAIYAKKAIDWVKTYEQGPHQLANANEPVQQRGLSFNINIVEASTILEGNICEVLDAATGFMLIKRCVLERMHEAYECLRCVNDVPGSSITEYIALYDCMIDPDSRRYLSEDYAFVRRAQLLGIKVHACLSSTLGHVGSYTFRPAHEMQLPACVGAPPT